MEQNAQVNKQLRKQKQKFKFPKHLKKSKSLSEALGLNRPGH
jgi:hypothetical protein